MLTFQQTCSSARFTAQPCEPFCVVPYLGLLRPLRTETSTDRSFRPTNFEH